jgi:hypothetical protein
MIFADLESAKRGIQSEYKKIRIPGGCGKCLELYIYNFLTSNNKNMHIFLFSIYFQICDLSHGTIILPMVLNTPMTCNNLESSDLF